MKDAGRGSSPDSGLTVRHLSSRVAARLQPLRRPNMILMRLRRLYFLLSYLTGFPRDFRPSSTVQWGDCREGLRFCLSSSQAIHHSDEGPHGAPPFPAVVHCLVWAVFPERIAPAQTIAVHKNDPTQYSAAINPRAAADAPSVMLRMDGYRGLFNHCIHVARTMRQGRPVIGHAAVIQTHYFMLRYTCMNFLYLFFTCILFH